jgi:hypothetical protein
MVMILSAKKLAFRLQGFDSPQNLFGRLDFWFLFFLTLPESLAGQTINSVISLSINNNKHRSAHHANYCTCCICLILDWE